MIGNALVFGAGFAACGFALFAVLRLAGVLPNDSWLNGLGLAVKFGFFGGAVGGAFSGVIGLLYRGQRLRNINWIRFGIAGGIVAGLFVPLFMQMLNVLSGDGMVPWALVFDDALWAVVFGGAVAGGSLKLAQRADRALPDSSEDEPDRLAGVD